MTVKAYIRRKLAPLLLGKRYSFQYDADGLAVRGRNLGALSDDRFVASWAKVAAFNEPFWPSGTPDIRWRCHVAIWAAMSGLAREGDFVEFGVNTGILSSMILENTDLDRSGRSFYLFDTFSGIPLDQVRDSELERARSSNRKFYSHDAFAVAQRVFAPYRSAKLVRGLLPTTLDTVAIEKIAYASVDLNNADAEIASIERIWDRIVPGGVVLLDDFAHRGYETQYDAWTTFAARHGRTVLTLPTGQGLLVK